MYIIDKHTRKISLGHADESLRIVIAGFGTQKIVTPAVVLEALAVVPEAHIAKLRSIVYTPQANTLYPHLAKPANVQGSYDAASHAVAIYQISSVPQFLHALYHEIGHGVFSHVLLQNDRYVWANELFAHEGSVTPYARTNPGEDFAESYAFYYLNARGLARLHKKFRFFKSRVFG